MSEQDRHEAFTLRYYREIEIDRAAVRSAHADAAHMCDAIAADIRREHTTRGRVTKRGEELAAAVRRAGDAIWRMREAVEEERLSERGGNCKAFVETDDPDRPLAIIGRLTRYEVHQGYAAPLPTMRFFTSPAIPWPKVRRPESPPCDGEHIPPDPMARLRMFSLMKRGKR